MRIAVPVAVCALFLFAAGAQAATCLRASQIQSTDASDGKFLILTMKNGDVWRGELQRACTGLRFSGFAWDVRGDQICENAQTLRVVSTGAICALGKLSLQPRPPRKG